MHDKEKFDPVKYKNKFIAETYDRINLTMPKGKKAIIKAQADKEGVSVNSFINGAIDDKLNR